MEPLSIRPSRQPLLVLVRGEEGGGRRGPGHHRGQGYRRVEVKLSSWVSENPPYHLLKGKRVKYSVWEVWNVICTVSLNCLWMPPPLPCSAPGKTEITGPQQNGCHGDCHSGMHVLGLQSRTWKLKQPSIVCRMWRNIISEMDYISKLRSWDCLPLSNWTLAEPCFTFSETCNCFQWNIFKFPGQSFLFWKQAWPFLNNILKTQRNKWFIFKG